MMKVLIAADMEGISGVVNLDHVNIDHPEYQRFRRLMTQDVNAAIQGAFEGGATEVVVTDGHWNGANILIEELDPRARLNSGTPSPFSMVEGVDNNVDVALFIGYHARMGTPQAVLDHTWSSARVENVWLNGRLVGETGLNAAVCGAFGVPVLLVTGDQSVCGEAAEWIDGVETVKVKQALSRHAAECLPLREAQALIRQGAAQSVRNFLAGVAPAPLKVARPVTLAIEFIYTDMADRASLLPGCIRRDGRKVEIHEADMPAAYRAFRAAIGLASR
jgi:D-amino peptidase